MGVHASFFWILLATVFSSVISITIAAFFAFRIRPGMIERMVSLSVGVMLSTALLHALPEAFQSGLSPSKLFATLLAGLLAFFVLEKCAIIRHSHHHEGDGHPHEEGHDQREAGSTGWMILLGDGFHNLTDGLIISAAFLADTYVGIVTAIAIFAHEIPQEIGDFIVLLNAGFSRKRAYCFNLLCSGLGIAGGIIGYYLLGETQWMIPYVLVLASAGFLYISVSDLMPQMQRRTSLRETIPQIGLIACGILLILALRSLPHCHGGPAASDGQRAFFCHS
ncbi:MAG: ZIP family metal transporter [Burkholderiaceae bacterium]|nr:ZIP family metal transporter [Burkholderiaceae bacterium]